MLRIEIDFNFDDTFVEMFERAGKNEYTIVQNGSLTTEGIRELLREVQKTKVFSGQERLGLLKILDDDTLVGLSVPRVITKKEHNVWCLPTDKEYHRMGMIYIDEPYRGKSFAKIAASLFKDQYPNLLWTIEPSNIASKKVAEYIGLKHNVTLYTNGKAWKHTPWKHTGVLEVWSN